MKFVLRGENNVKVVISEGANGYEELLSAWQNIQNALAILRRVGYVSIGDITVSLRKYDDGREELVGFDWMKDYDEFRIPIPKGEEVEIKDVSAFLKAGEYAGLVPSAYEKQKQKTLLQVYERLKSLYAFVCENGLNPEDIILYYDLKTKQEVSLAELVNVGLEKLGEYNLRDIEGIARNINTAKRVVEKHLENIQSKSASPNL